MSNLRPRKWGCALGITLLTAVVIVCALLLGAALTRPKSAQDMLRSMPLFPGASHVEYDLFDRSARTNWEGDAAQVAYQVNEQPEAVVAFYVDKLIRDGWYSSDQSGNHANLHRTDRPLHGH